MTVWRGAMPRRRSTLVGVELGHVLYLAKSPPHFLHDLHLFERERSWRPPWPVPPRLPAQRGWRPALPR